MGKRYKIGELSAACGISVPAIRFYEHKGVISPAVRTLKNQRLFDESTLERLRFIHRCRRLNMPLACICRILYARQKQAQGVPELIGNIEHYIEEVHSLRADLEDVEKILQETLAGLQRRQAG